MVCSVAVLTVWTWRYGDEFRGVETGMDALIMEG